MARMFLMCGHPGSGKSFFAKRMAKFNGFRYLSIDDMYATFNGDSTSHDNKFDVWITFFRQIHAAEMAGQDVVIDTNAPTRADRFEFLNWFSNFEHHLIWIDTDEELCLKNNQHRSRVIPEGQMKKLFEIFEIPSPYDTAFNRTRSDWKSITRIVNENNIFTETTTVSKFQSIEDFDFCYTNDCEEREHNRRERERERRERAKQKNKYRTEFIKEWNDY